MQVFCANLQVFFLHEKNRPSHDRSLGTEPEHPLWTAPELESERFEIFVGSETLVARQLDTIALMTFT